MHREVGGAKDLPALRYKFFWGGKVTQKIWYLICAAKGSCTNVTTKKRTLFWNL